MSGASDPLSDYYAVLQVDPRAEPEVIEAAYRRLMLMYHPDRAGDDPRRAAEYEQRARMLNEANSVLRDPAKRKRYDEMRRARGWGAAPPPSGYAPPASAAPGTSPAGAAPSPGTTPRPDPGSTPPAGPGSEDAGAVIVPAPSSGLPGPLALFGAAYYLLPGPYEWEPGSRTELLTVVFLPAAGLAAFALLSGRLDAWIGHSLNATLLAWGLIVLLCLPMLTSLPRVAAAGGPAAVLLSGAATPMLHQAHVPVWFAWGVASLVSVILAARLFVFGVLPTLAACWLIAQIS